MNIALTRPADTQPFLPAQYLVWPMIGVCVVGPERTIEAGGASSRFLQCVSIKDTRTILSMPVHRIPTSAVRRLSTPAELEDALTLLSGKAGKRASAWLKAAQGYEASLRQGDVRSVAAVLHAMIGKFRHEKFAKNPVGTDLRGLESLSYSERSLAFQSLDLLSQEISFVTGQAEQSAKEMILSSALIPGYAPKLSSGLSVKSAMEESRFKDIFKMTPKEAVRAAGREVIHIEDMKEKSPINSVSTYSTAPRQKRFTGRSLQTEKAANDTAKKPLAVSSKPAKGKAQGRKGAAATLGPLFAEEAGNVPPKGSNRAYLIKASHILDALEFRVLVRTGLRVPALRITMAVVATELGLSVEEAVKSRNSAANKLRVAFADKPHLLKHPVFQSYAEKLPKAPRALKAAKAPSVKVPVIKEKAPRQPRDAKSLAEAAVVRRRESNIASMREENRPIYLQELPHLVRKGPSGRLLLKAAAALDATEFSLALRVGLRQLPLRQTLPDAARDMGLSMDQVIPVRNSIAQKLAAAGFSASNALVKPYVPPVERLVRERAPAKAKSKTGMSVPEQMRALYDSESPFVSPRGHRRGAFNKAAGILAPEAFAVYSALHLRRDEHKMQFPAVARAMGVEEEEVRELFRSASFTMGDLQIEKPAPAVHKPRSEKPEHRLGEQFAREGEFVPAKGAVRAVFNKAGEILSAEEFETFARAKLRAQFIEPLHVQSKSRNMPMGRLIGLHDAAVEKLSRAFAESGSRVAEYKMFRKYEKPPAPIPKRDPY